MHVCARTRRTRTHGRRAVRLLVTQRSIEMPRAGLSQSSRNARKGSRHAGRSFAPANPGAAASLGASINSSSLGCKPQLRCIVTNVRNPVRAEDREQLVQSNMKACILSMLLLQSCLASATAFVCSPLGDSSRRHVQACGTEARRQSAGVSMGGVGVPGGESLAEQEYDIPVGCRRLRIPTVCRRFKRTVPVAYTSLCLPFPRSRSLARSASPPAPLSFFCNANISRWDLF